jgi:hypothetical protein
MFACLPNGGSVMFRAILAFLAVVSLASMADAAPKNPKECAAIGEGPGAREELVRKAPGCDAAMEEFAACAYGASGDTELGRLAQEKCEADFLPRLGKSRRAAYAAAIRRCDRKYRNEGGTMYRSFEAFCRAEVAQRYARSATKTGPRR